MAKKITKVWEDDDYKVFKNKWRNKGEYKIVKEIRERFDEMKEGRRTSCPWASYIEEPATGSDSAYAKDYESIKYVSTGTNWADRWNLDYMLWSMYHTYDSDRSNLKSPISFAPTEAAMAEFQEGNVTVSMSPTEEDDFKKARIKEHAFRHWEVDNSINTYKATSFHEDMITGSTWGYIGWITSFREEEIIITGENIGKEISNMNLSPELEQKLLTSQKGEEVSIDELKNLIGKEKEDRQQAVYNIARQKPITKHITFKEFDDAVFVPESVYDIYVDNRARYMNAPAYGANDLIKREVISFDQTKIRFTQSNDPWIIRENLKKITSAKDASDLYQTQDSRFFEIPDDISTIDEDNCEVLHYYNKSTDKYIIIVNDVIIRKGPLPFNHAGKKKIPFSFHKFIEWPNMFYGIGMPVILECLQSEDETLRNMMLDQLKLTINPPVFINTDIFQDVDIGWEEVTPGLKVEVSGSVGPENIRWFEGTNPRMDYFRIRDGLKSDAIEATGINPIAYSIPKPNEAVRTHIMSMESTMKILKKGIKNWAEGYKEAAKQVIENMKQKYPLSHIEQIDGQGNIIKKSRMIKTKGLKIDANTLEEEQIDKDKYGYLEFKEDFFSGEIDVEINTDTLLPMTKGLQIEKVKEALQTLPVVMANPDVMNIPGISDLIKKYVELLGVGESVTEQLQDTSSEEEVINAQKQNEVMANEEYLEGIPGESYAHKDQHRILLMDSYKLLSQMKPDATTIAQKTKLQTVIDILEKHIMSDDTPKSEGIKSALGRGQSLKQPPMQAQGGMPPQGGMPTEAMMGGQMPANQAMGMPAPGGMPGAPAGVPMPPQGM